jgi:cysteine desulfuration protein SufE
MALYRRNEPAPHDASFVIGRASFSPPSPSLSQILAPARGRFFVRRMTVQARQRDLIATYALIADRRERLALVIEAARGAPTLPPAERKDAKLVGGCQSRVWLDGTCRDGGCHFCCASESPLVHGLVSLLCASYEGCTPADVVTTEPTVLEELGLWQDLSPTRQNGLRAVRARLKTLAATLA